MTEENLRRLMIVQLEQVKIVLEAVRTCNPEELEKHFEKLGRVERNVENCLAIVDSEIRNISN